MPIVSVDLQAGDDGQFTAAERAIFRFGGGLPWVGDPLAIEERYEQALAEQNAGAISQWLNRATVNHRLLAYRKLVPVAHAALGIGPFDDRTGAGLAADEALAVLGRFHRFQDRLTARFRRDAELLATFGPLPRHTHSYARHCGLWWNRERVQALAAVAHWRALLAAGGAARLHFSLADAMSPNRAAARVLDEQIEHNRAEAEARTAAAQRGGR